MNAVIKLLDILTHHIFELSYHIFHLVGVASPERLGLLRKFHVFCRLQLQVSLHLLLLVHKRIFCLDGCATNAKELRYHASALLHLVFSLSRLKRTDLECFDERGLYLINKILPLCKQVGNIFTLLFDDPVDILNESLGGLYAGAFQLIRLAQAIGLQTLHGRVVKKGLLRPQLIW